MPKSIKELFDLTGRVTVITGGAGMLGREYTHTLAEAGACVVVADKDLEAAEKVAEEARRATGGEVIGLGVDVSDKASVDQMTAEIKARFQRLDILVNNAAIDPKFDAAVAHQQSHRFEDYPLDLWQASLDVNLTGTFLCCQAAGKMMVPQGGGVIVNICSVYGLVAPDQRLYQQDGEEEQQLFKPAAYSVTKAGVAHLTRYLAAYWGDKNIRVNTLTPGGVYNAQDDTFVRKYAERTPMGRMAEKHEMSAALLYLVSDASSYMTGGNQIVDGGWTAW